MSNIPYSICTPLHKHHTQQINEQPSKNIMFTLKLFVLTDILYTGTQFVWTQCTLSAADKIKKNKMVSWFSECSINLNNLFMSSGQLRDGKIVAYIIVKGIH